jgi:hypothetical protein
MTYGSLGSAIFPTSATSFEFLNLYGNRLNLIEPLEKRA